MNEALNKVQAQPSKAFFIDMITRDLGITDCLLDLIDNAIDKAISQKDLDVMALLTNGASPPAVKGAQISVAIHKDRVEIQDTCGGISVAEARDKVFRFGLPIEQGREFGLSVFGIGMKRAFFKLGKIIQMESATDSESFVIDIDVDAWQRKGDKDWEFEFTSFGPLKKGTRKGSTRIEITHLQEGVGERLSQLSFRNDFSDKLAATYALFLRSGLRIDLNDHAVASSLPTVARTEKLTIARKLFRHKGVEVLIIAGVTAAEDKKSHGWYVFCNGRMVLEADKTILTGWDRELPKFHAKYNHFVGYVYFKSEDVQNLPWTTTKQGVVYESPVYQAALMEMKIQARPVLNFLNDLYPGDLVEEGNFERGVLRDSKSVEIDEIEKKQTHFAVISPSEVRKREQHDWVSIQYLKERKQIDRAKELMGKKRISASNVGSYTFDYYLKQESE